MNWPMNTEAFLSTASGEPVTAEANYLRILFTLTPPSLGSNVRPLPPEYLKKKP